MERFLLVALNKLFLEAATTMRHKPDTRTPFERAEHYRFRARELRAIAEEWMDSGARDALTRIAKDYEHLAAQLEKQVKFPPVQQDDGRKRRQLASAHIDS